MHELDHELRSRLRRRWGKASWRRSIAPPPATTRVRPGHAPLSSMQSLPPGHATELPNTRSIGRQRKPPPTRRRLQTSNERLQGHQLGCKIQDGGARHGHETNGSPGDAIERKTRLGSLRSAIGCDGRCLAGPMLRCPLESEGRRFGACNGWHRAHQAAVDRRGHDAARRAAVMLARERRNPGRDLPAEPRAIEDAVVPHFRALEMQLCEQPEHRCKGPAPRGTGQSR